MAIFGFIECDSIVQVNDKFRIDGSKSYISKGEAAITEVEIEPETGSGFISVLGSTPIKAENWFLDWQYSSAGSKVVSIRITTNGAPVTITKTIQCVTEVDDRLFSSDFDLVAVESSVLKYVPKGKNTFKYIHREAQNQILEWLYVNGYRGYENERLDKEDVIDIENVKYWSTYLSLKLIFEDLSNQSDDVFMKKAKEFEKKEHLWRENISLKLDINKDGTQGAFEAFNMTTRELIRK